MPTPTPTATPTPVAVGAAAPVTFTILYDNNAGFPDLQTAWGFACLVESGETTLLFDTGGDSAVLLSNMALLGKDPRVIDLIVLSHIHGDHTGGLTGLLDHADAPTVYVPAAFPASFKAGVRSRTTLVEVAAPLQIAPGIMSTGPVDGGIVEQALAVETAEGWAVVTGCAHPGIVSMVREARACTDGEIALVMGGFHLGQASSAKLSAIIADFEALGVQRAAPTHCSGDRARAAFSETFRGQTFLVGAGSVLVLE